jgi:hypothetical protein
MLEKRSIKNIHIYILKDPETQEVRYVGKTKHSLNKRLWGHLNQVETTHKYNWINSLKAKDLIPIIESVEKVSNETWSEREMFWIQHYKDLGAKLTNSNEGGLGGHNVSDEVRVKLSATQKGRKRSAETRAKMSAAKQKMSDETKAKMSISRTGKKLSKEHHAKMLAAITRKKCSAETRAKISAANKGKIRSIESIEKARTSNTGKKRSAESRARMSVARQNISDETRAKLSFAAKNISDETRAKLSNSQKLRHAKRNKIPFNNKKPFFVEGKNQA